MKVGDLVVKKEKELWIFTHEDDPDDGKVSTIIRRIDDDDKVGVIFELSSQEYEYAKVLIDGTIGWCYITSLKGVTNNE